MPGPRSKVQGPRSKVLDTWYLILDSWSLILDRWSLIYDPWSMIHVPWLEASAPRMSLRSGPVRSGGLVPVGPVLVGLVQVGPVRHCLHYLHYIIARFALFALFYRTICTIYNIIVIICNTNLHYLHHRDSFHGYFNLPLIGHIISPSGKRQNKHRKTTLESKKKIDNRFGDQKHKKKMKKHTKNVIVSSQTIILTKNSAMGPQKSESAWKLLHSTPTYVEFGATWACFVTKQSKESMFRHKRSYRPWIRT